MFSTLDFRPVGKLAVLGVIIVGISACSGGAGSGTAPVPNRQFCGNDTQYALARPQSGTTLPSGVSTIEIVANGNGNQIAQSYQNFNLLFVPANTGGQTIASGPLSLASDPNGYHPFTSDYYYNGTVGSPGLFPGTVYNVFVNAFTSNCSPVGPIGQFGT